MLASSQNDPKQDNPSNQLKKLKQCSVVFDDGTRCPRLATKTIEHMWICSRCYSKMKNEILVEHALGRTDAESKASMKAALDKEIPDYG